MPDNIQTDPPGAEISLGEYRTPESAWAKFGVSPIQATGPRGPVRYRITRKCYDTAEGFINTFEGPFELTLQPAGQSPPSMVYVPEGNTYDGKTVPGFWLDRYEVTNAEYKKFVDAGEYRDSRFWKQPFPRPGGTSSFEEVMALFRDSTGRAGPAAWRFGSYPPGQENYTVSGVSWFEATAYAGFAGKSLPTLRHWQRSAGIGNMLTILRLSNYSKMGPAEVGRYKGLGPFGTYDTAGNVSEWCSTGVSGQRYLMGTNWNDPSYEFTSHVAYDPFLRDPAWGLRCARFPVPPSDDLLADAPSSLRDARKEKIASDDEFRSLASLYSYYNAPLAPKLESSRVEPAWRHEVVTVDAAYAGERLPMRLYLPRNGKPPYQTVILLPPSGGLQKTNSEHEVDFWYGETVLVGGRAYLLPVQKGVFERKAPFPGPAGNRDRTIFWVKDAIRSIDYIQSRPDLDHDRIGVLAVSLGARYVPLLLAVEQRIKAAVILNGGLPKERMLEPIEPLNFVTRVTQPLLMLNSRQDFVFPLESTQRPLFDLLGTPPGRKKHLLHDTFGHIPPKSDEFVKALLAWYDTYLGPVIAP